MPHSIAFSFRTLAGHVAAGTHQHNALVEQQTEGMEPGLLKEAFAIRCLAEQQLQCVRGSAVSRIAYDALESANARIRNIQQGKPVPDMTPRKVTNVTPVVNISDEAPPTNVVEESSVKKPPVKPPEFDVLVYGAYGYTAKLFIPAALEKGWRLLLAGRNKAKMRELMASLPASAKGYVESQVFDLADHAALDEAVARATCVMNAAGPYSETTVPVANACLRQGRHYMDVSGEWRESEKLRAMGGEAARAGVMLMVGLGFDIMPTDVALSRVLRRLPEAHTVDVGIRGVNGAFSRGTARTVNANEAAKLGGAVVRDGKLVALRPDADEMRRLDYGKDEEGLQDCKVGGFPDVSSAMARGVKNFSIGQSGGVLKLAAMPESFRVGLLTRSAAEGATGPDAKARGRSYNVIVAQALGDGKVKKALSRVRVPDGCAPLRVEPSTLADGALTSLVRSRARRRGHLPRDARGHEARARGRRARGLSDARPRLRRGHPRGEPRPGRVARRVTLSLKARPAPCPGIKARRRRGSTHKQPLL